MRSTPVYLLLLLICFCLLSCEFKCSVGDSSEKKDKKETSAYKPVDKEGALIYNGIQVSAHKVKLSKAYLIERDGENARIEEGNFVDIKKGVKLILIIDSGWVLKNEKVSMGAAMKVTAENGEVVLDREDMFKDSGESIDPEDAKTIGLSVFFTDWKVTEPVTLTVTFRVWDKNSDAYLEGSYIIHTK